jgi:hypothetical protein
MVSPDTRLHVDLDGTSVETVYAHVVAWQRALEQVDILIDGWTDPPPDRDEWRLFTRAVAREIGRPLSAGRAGPAAAAPRRALPPDAARSPTASRARDLLRMLGVRREDYHVMGDVVSDRRAGMLSISLLSGGYGREELMQAGALRVYRDPQGHPRLARWAGRHPRRLAFAHARTKPRTRGLPGARTRAAAT